MYRLGFVPIDRFDPNPIYDIALDYWESQKVKALVPEFPSVFEQAVIDWTKLKLVAKSRALDSGTANTALEWFREFPQLWETIRPNFANDPEQVWFADSVDQFVLQLGNDSYFKTGQLGAVSIVVAGVAIVGGVAAALWAVGFIKEQNNISGLIDAAAAGTISEEVLQEALENSSVTNPLDSISGLLKWVAIVGVGVAILPKVWSFAGAKR